MATRNMLLVFLMVLLVPTMIVVEGGNSDEERVKPKDQRRRLYDVDEEMDPNQKDERDFVIFLSKCLIVSWLVILALIIGFIFKYKQAKTAQQIAEEAERQKRKNEREKKLLTRGLSKGGRTAIKEKDKRATQVKTDGNEKKHTPEEAGIKEGGGKDDTAVDKSPAKRSTADSSNAPTQPQAETDGRPAGSGDERDWYLKKIAELEKLVQSEKEKRLDLKRRFKDLTEEKVNMEQRVEDEKKKYAELEGRLRAETQRWEEKMDKVFKEKCVEEGKCVELKKRIDEEKAKNEELEKRVMENAVLLEGERRKYAELNKQFEELNSHLMEMLTSVDKKRQEKKRQATPSLDDEDF